MSFSSEQHILQPVSGEQHILHTVSGEPEEAATVQDVPPDGGYGWVCMICALVINANTWGVNNAWAVFLAQYLSESTFPNASTLEYALIGGLSISQALAVSPLVGLTTSRLGPRWSMLIGAVLVSASLAASSFATQIWHLFLTQGACFGYGMGFLYITSSTTVPQWFSTKRSLAIGLAASGAGIGGIAYSLIAGAGVEAVGVKAMYRIFAIATAVMNISSACLLKGRRHNSANTGRERFFEISELRNVPVVLVCIWGFLTELGYITLLYSLPTYAESVGLSLRQGSVIGAMLNIGLALGRPVVGLCSDRFGRINIAMLMTALCGVFCYALWIPAQSYGLLIAFALASGTVTGTFWGTVTPVATEVVGLQRMPAAFAIICIPLVLPTTFGEAIALQLTTTYGYVTSQAFVGAMFLAGAVSVWLLRAWQVNAIEEKARREQESAYSEGFSSIRRRNFWLSPKYLFVLRRV